MNSCNPASSAHVDLVAANNGTFTDALQFDPPVAGVTGPAWSFSNQNFRMDVKPNKESAALVSFTSPSQIVVDDVTLRILHFNVPETVLSAAGVIPGEYVYDLIMYDNSVPPIRVPIAHGKFTVTDGVTGG